MSGAKSLRETLQSLIGTEIILHSLPSEIHGGTLIDIEPVKLLRKNSTSMAEFCRDSEIAQCGCKIHERRDAVIVFDNSSVVGVVGFVDGRHVFGGF